DYKEGITKHDAKKVPQAIVAVSVICAKTTEEAEALALSNQLWKVLQDKGEGQNGVPSIEEARSYHFNDKELEKMAQIKQKKLIGNADEVKQQLFDLQKQYNVDQLMIVTITHDYEARRRSYELIAEACF